MGVDPGAAILQPGGGLHGLADILGPDGGGEAVIAVVRPGNGLLGLGEAGDGDDRANTSRRTISSSCRAPAITVGWKKKPSLLPLAPPVVTSI